MEIWKWSLKLCLLQVLLKLQEQWSLTDITTPGLMDRFLLPADLAVTGPGKSVLPGQYRLQVQYGYDVGSPAYGQLQKLHNVDRENARVSADDSQASQAGGGGYQATQGGQYQAAWEPRPQRVMMLTLTDGQTTVEAMEHQTVRCLPDVIAPGTKLQLLGPVTVRRGILLLTDTNTRLLGGEVDEIKEQFSLQTILQQKIGKEDVGQRNRFAGTNSGVTRPPPVRTLPTATAPAPHPPAPAATPAPPPRIPSNEIDDIPDDDDEMLLMAASQVENTQEDEPLVPRVTASPPRVSSSWSRGGHGATAGPPVGVVQPLRTIQPCNDTGGDRLKNPTNISSDKSNKSSKTIAQSSIISFMKTKDPAETDARKQSQATSSIPTFSLLDSDEEFESDMPLEPSPKKTKPSEPFNYLVNFKKSLAKKPSQTLSSRFKVVSSTLASKLHLKRTEQGPQWSVMIMLNDGSESIKADIDPRLLEEEIGPPLQYLEQGSKDPRLKAEFKGRMKRFSCKLAELNCIVTLRAKHDNYCTVIKMDDISGLHLALMRKRRK